MQSETQWVLVPREPTEEMVSAAMMPDDAMAFGDRKLAALSMKARYAAMLSAAPSPPAGGGEPVAWVVMAKGRPLFVGLDEHITRAYSNRYPTAPLYLAPDAAQQRIRELEEAAQDVLDEVDKMLAIDPPPIKYRAPYGTLAKLRALLRARTAGGSADE